MCCHSYIAVLGADPRQGTEWYHLHTHPNYLYLLQLVFKVRQACFGKALFWFFCGFFPVAIWEVIASRYCQHKCGLLSMKIEAFKILCLSWKHLTRSFTQMISTASRLRFASRNEAHTTCKLGSPAFGSQPHKVVNPRQKPSPSRDSFCYLYCLGSQIRGCRVKWEPQTYSCFCCIWGNSSICGAVARRTEPVRARGQASLLSSRALKVTPGIQTQNNA